MGNANGREEGDNGSDDPSRRSIDEDGESSVGGFPMNPDRPIRIASSDSMGHSPPASPGPSRSPHMFAPQLPVAPLQRGDALPVFNQMWMNEPNNSLDLPPEEGIPTMIMWSSGGNNVSVEGSWDNWTSRRALQRSGKDHSILLVLPSGIYRYRFIVDGERRYLPDLPYTADETGIVHNLLDVHVEVMMKEHICECLSNIGSTHSLLTLFLPNHDASPPLTKTGAQFVEGVQSLALGLIQLGIKPGHIVAIAALNSDLYLQWMLAVAYVGAIISPLNYRWSLDEAQSALESLQPVMLVLDHTCASWLHNFNLPCLKWHVSLGHSFNAVLTTINLSKSLQPSTSLHYQWAPDGVVLICFTSGTSGKPKGVCIGHTALIVQARAKISIVGYSQDDVYLHTAPLCHIGGISSGMAMLMAGACHVIVPRFESQFVLQAIEQHHVSSLITVPAMMADMISYIRSHNIWKGGKYMKKILNGGGQLSVDLIKDAAEAFPEAKIISAYGMTETCSSLTFITLHPMPCKNSYVQCQKTREGKSCVINQMGSCVGKPAPHVELMIDDSDPSSVGRIFTRGPHVMIKYWNQDSAKTSDSPHQGWLDTGDIGYLDDYGDLWLKGRSNDRIKSGGENVYPEEVEAILSRHPGLCGIVVVGVPDARLSEMVVACLQIKEQWEWIDQSCGPPPHTEKLKLCSDSLYKYCKEKKLTRFKIPKVFIPWTSPFPVTSTGKLRRDDVRREAVSLLRLYPTKSSL